METTQKTKHQIIDEIAAHYNSNNRAATKDLNGHEVCQYNAIGEGGKVCHCAFAILCIDPVNDLQAYECTKASEVIIRHPKHQELLKPEYRGHQGVFYNMLQVIHDNHVNWDVDGLSELGKKAVERLKAYQEHEYNTVDSYLKLNW